MRPAARAVAKATKIVGPALRDVARETRALEDKFTALGIPGDRASMEVRTMLGYCIGRLVARKAGPGVIAAYVRECATLLLRASEVR